MQLLLAWFLKDEHRILQTSSFECQTPDVDGNAPSCSCSFDQAVFEVGQASMHCTADTEIAAVFAGCHKW